jgi:putative ABC transport system permease protein
MMARLLRGAARLHPARLALVVLSTAMGSGIAGALGAVALQARDRIAEEMRSFGANVVVEPRRAAVPDGPAPPAFLDAAQLPRVLTIFWRHNLVGLAPSLTAPARVAAGGTDAAGGSGERALLAGVWFDRPLARPGGEGTLRAGVVPLFPFWGIEGAWPAPDERGSAVVGHALAERLGLRPGGRVAVDVRGRTADLRVAGVVRTGGFEDEEVLVQLELAQELLEAPGAISRALVSAVTVPLDDFGRRDPAGMTRREFEKWFCTPYVTSVAHQVAEAIPGSRARPVWSLAEAEARVLSRLDVLMALLAGLTLLAASLAVASTFAARVLGRRAEIALMRACGASAGQVALLLGAEVLALGALGGLLGAALASALVAGLGAAVFRAALEPGPILLPLSLAGSLLVAAVGAVWPIRRALALDPAAELKEAA